MVVTSREVARYLDAEHVGADVDLTGIGSLDTATDSDLAFCTYHDPSYIQESAAGAVVCPPSLSEEGDGTKIISSEPRTAFVLAVRALFIEDDPDTTTIHPSASVDEGARVGSGCHIGPHVAIGADVIIGDGCTIRAGAAIGCDGFGFARDDQDELHRLPHRGTVRLEDGVEIGANTTVDRAVFEETVIGRNTKVSANVHIAHQVRIGEHTTVAYGAGFSGRVTVGDAVTIHPHVAVADGVSIGDGAEIGINSTVLSDVAPGTTVVGTPARPTSTSDAESTTAIAESTTADEPEDEPRSDGRNT